MKAFMIPLFLVYYKMLVVKVRACSHKNATHVFFANFAANCVKNICRATARLHIFALLSAKLRSKIRTFILCEHALKINLVEIR